MFKFIITLSLLCITSSAYAALRPSGQIAIGNAQVLRGEFSEIREFKGTSTTFISSGHFVALPAAGLIWNVEKPMATSTVITSSAVIQDIGGLAIKLPAKNLQHLFTMVGGAITGDWSGLETDFTLAQSGNTNHWQMTMTPNGNTHSAYSSIVVTGSKYVESIVLTKADNTHDSFKFTNTNVSPTPLTADERHLFAEAGKPI